MDRRILPAARAQSQGTPDRVHRRSDCAGGAGGGRAGVCPLPGRFVILRIRILRCPTIIAQNIRQRMKTGLLILAPLLLLLFCDATAGGPEPPYRFNRPPLAANA